MKRATSTFDSCKNCNMYIYVVAVKLAIHSHCAKYGYIKRHIIHARDDAVDRFAAESVSKTACCTTQACVCCGPTWGRPTAKRLDHMFEDCHQIRLRRLF